MKILNLYACLGGNRYKWDEVADNLKITAVELDPEAARLYKERFPNDTVIVADAHEYLLNYYKEFDFIWSSPPCPSHSRARFARKSTTSAIYPDLKLYEEILFLENYFEGKYCVENVISGDLFVSVDRVCGNALQHNVSFEDELHRVSAHGVLHLIGFKDKSDEDSLLMTQAEDNALTLRFT